jgi:hypothetical protein
MTCGGIIQHPNALYGIVGVSIPLPKQSPRGQSQSYGGCDSGRFFRHGTRQS